VRKMDGVNLEGMRIQVEFAKEAPSKGPRGGGEGYRLVAEGLSSQTSWQDLKVACLPYFSPVCMPASTEGVFRVSPRPPCILPSCSVVCPIPVFSPSLPCLLDTQDWGRKAGRVLFTDVFAGRSGDKQGILGCLSSCTSCHVVEWSEL
jgi:hypothetical protein